MTFPTKAQVRRAKNLSPWEIGNRVLYKMCEDHPRHRRPDDVIAKIWLIGRAYAAAIERRKTQDSNLGDVFYTNVVVPTIIASDIDRWIAKAMRSESRADILDAHFKTTNLFNAISGLGKRSLASKYLHFHAPHLFYILDQRARKGLAGITELRTVRGAGWDNQYRLLYDKCSALTVAIQERYSIKLSPRQVDNLLLSRLN